MNDHTQGNRETADVSRESVSEDDLAHYSPVSDSQGGYD
jgi:hypothetical protein